MAAIYGGVAIVLVLLIIIIIQWKKNFYFIFVSEFFKFFKY